MEHDDDPAGAPKRTDFLPRTRCTKPERLAIEAKARDAGLSLSEYQRRACLNGVVVVQNERQRADVLRQLAAIGNNLNQIARKLHMRGDLNSPSALRLVAVLGALETLLDEAAGGS
jgi:hypothetical protein